MSIPADYKDGFTFSNVDNSRNSVNTIYLTNSDRLFVVDAPASFSKGTAVVRNAHLTTSTSDVYYGDSDLGKLDDPLETPKQCGFTVDEANDLIVYSGENGVYRTYGFFPFGFQGMVSRDIGTVREYTGIGGFFKSPASVGEGCVASENKIYLNNEGDPPFFSPFGSWNNISHNPNTPNDFLDETSNYTIKKRPCNDSSAIEYITDSGQPYAPEGLMRSSTTIPSNLPSKVATAGSNAVLWVCSKTLNKISLTVNTEFIDPSGVTRVKGEVLIENSAGNQNTFSPISLANNLPYISSDRITFKPVEWICLYVGCTDGYVRLMCWNIIPSSNLIKDERGCLWVVYDAQPPV